MSRPRLGLIIAMFLIFTAAGCAPIPRVELVAYTTAFSDVQAVTNGVLDIVVPYERMVIRYTSQTTTQPISAPDRSQPRTGFAAQRPSAFSPTAAMPTAPIELGLFIDPAAARAAAEAANRPVTPMPSPRSPEPGATGTAAVAIDPSLFANPEEAKAAAAAANRPIMETPRPQSRRTGRGSQMVPMTVANERVCKNGYGGPDPFCYETRAAYADIGDPPLVAAYRNLWNVILRFNNLLVAYADGVSGRLLEQDLAALSSAVGTLTNKAAPIASFTGAGAFAAGLPAIVDQLKPIANLAGNAIDRAQLQRFLMENADRIDAAIGFMAENSEQLYANVAVGTVNFEVKASGSDSQALNARQREIRRLIANWTVLLDDIQVLLKELKTAVEIPDGLETRLRNLDSTMEARIDTSTLKKEIATLGTPMLVP